MTRKTYAGDMKKKAFPQRGKRQGRTGNEPPETI